MRSLLCSLLLVLLLAGGSARQWSDWAPGLPVAAVAIAASVAPAGRVASGEPVAGTAAFVARGRQRPPAWLRQRSLLARGLPAPRAPDA